MEITLPWGTTELKLNLPETWDVIIPEQPVTRSVTPGDALSLVKKSLEQPVGSAPLGNHDLKDKNIVIIVDDNTRPTPIASFFSEVLKGLKKAGAAKKNITLITALGIHTAMSGEEMEEKVGKKNLAGLNWVNHDAFSTEENSFFGTTSRGTEVYLNKRLTEADFIVSIGMIEPHIWAGFGGGMKNILPGVAASSTISQHHEIITEPPYRFNRVGMDPEKNSFRNDLEEIRSMINAPVFIVNVLVDHQGQVTGSVAGDPVLAHREGVSRNRKHAGINLQKPVDAIIVNSHPMDINFKQSMKGVGNSLPALKPGGVVMGFLRAERGLDDIVPPEDVKPLWLVKTILRILGPSRVFWFLNKVKKGLNVEEKFLVYYSMQVMRAYDLYFHVPTVSDEEVKRLGFFVNHQEPQQVIDAAAKKLKENVTVAVFPQAGGTFPEMFQDPFFPLK